MKVDLFDFTLPEGLIALRPAEPRESARLLIVKDGAMRDSWVRDLPDWFAPGDLVVLNDTKVIPAFLEGRRGEMTFSCNLHKRLSHTAWWGFAKKAGRLREGDRVTFGEGFLNAVVTQKKEDGEILLQFETENNQLDEKLKIVGVMPLPPYIASRRGVDARDTRDYQTIFAQKEGAVAAPTASLHLTPSLIERLRDKGVRFGTLTLHVGAGTFLPVKAEDTKAHTMHAEWGEISEDLAKAVNETRRQGGRIVAVGTTVLRLLESAATKGGEVKPFKGETQIFITPGFRFKVVDVLMTNFHLPRSTLFMLVSAFAGLETMKAAYAHAIRSGYRFYSYGDGSVLFR